MSYLLQTKHALAILELQDEAYGNTPLHIACQMYSDTIVQLLFKTDRSQLEKNNLAGQTPLGVLD